MFDRLRQKWRVLRGAKPGERFQEFHRQRQKSRRSAWKKPLILGAGMLIALAGLIMLFTPGPGILLLVVGAGFIAQESLLAARALDWLEVKGRQLARWSVSRWRQSSLTFKGFLLLLGVLSTATVGWGAYRLFVAP